MTGEWVSVIPAPGKVAETARTLLGLAAHPGEVRTAKGGREFLVPSDLADAYAATTAPKKPRQSRKKEDD